MQKPLSDTQVAKTIETRLRQLHRYLEQQLPPATSARQEKRRLTLRHRVIADFVKNIAHLHSHRDEVGWKWHLVTETEREYIDTLATGDPLKHGAVFRQLRNRANFVLLIQDEAWQFLRAGASIRPGESLTDAHTRWLKKTNSTS